MAEPAKLVAGDVDTPELSRAPVAEVEPPRTCSLVVVPVTNPIQTTNERRALCGRTPRRADQLAADQELVTCPLCREALAAKKGVPYVVPGITAPLPAAPPPGGYRQLLDSMNVEQLEAKKADLEGELAALGVLLDAARRRQEAQKKAT